MKRTTRTEAISQKKSFELSKFDYLNSLTKVTNNQYVNEVLENFFKFLNLKYDPRYPRLLDYHSFKDKKSNQNLLGDNYQIYMNVLLRFNSERYQFRQMIEACQTNEELTNLIRCNRLNHKLVSTSSSSPSTSTASPHNLVTSSIDEFIITKENWDLIFNDSKPLIMKLVLTIQRNRESYSL